MFDKFKQLSILVVGDIILDAYKIGKAERLSPEAPVPLISIKKEFHRLGGAANVANNLVHLGCNVDLCGVIGDDHVGQSLFELLQKEKIGTEYVHIDKNTCTISKTRIIADDQHVVRYDKEEPCDKTYSHIIENLQKNCDKYNCIIVSDYNKGFVKTEIIEILKNKNKKIYADIKPAKKDLYNGIYCITPNFCEAKQMIGAELHDIAMDEISSYEIAMHLKHYLNLQCIAITLSDRGAVGLCGDNNFVTMPTHICCLPKERHSRLDVTGAGDTFISILASAECIGLDFITSMKLANIGASIVVNKLGTCVCEVDELERELKLGET